MGTAYQQPFYPTNHPGVPPGVQVPTPKYVPDRRAKNGDCSSSTPGRGHGRGSGNATKERGHYSLPQCSGLLQQGIPCLQEERNVSSRHQPPTPQPIPIHPFLLHDNDQGHFQPLAEGALGHLHRSSGRLFSHTSPQASSKIPSVYLARTGLPVPVSPLWPLYQPTHFRPCDKTSAPPTTHGGDPSSCLPRRLSSSCPLSYTGSQRRPQDSCLIERSRLQHQLGEDQLVPVPRIHLPGTLLEHQRPDSQPPIRQTPPPASNGSSPPTVTSHNSQEVDAVPRQSQLCSVRYPTGQASLPRATERTQSRLQTTKGPQEGARPESGSQSRVTVLAAGRIQPPLTSPPTARDHNGDRCFEERVGSEPSVHDSSRTVATRGEEPAHKSAGDEGSLGGSPSVQDPPTGEVCVCPDRQQDHSGLSGQGGGNQIQSALPPCQAGITVVPRTHNYPVPSACKGNGQHGGRLPVSRQGDRVASESSCGGGDIPEVWDPSYRSLRLTADSPTPKIHVPGEVRQESVRSGCFLSEMDLPPPVRISTPNPSPNSPEQAAGFDQSDAPDSPVLERCPMAPSAPEESLRHPQPTTDNTGHHPEHGNRLPSEGPRDPSPSGMATMRRATGVSLPARAFTTLENSWRQGTRRQYMSVWRVWQRWCTDQHLDTTTISVDKLITYLQHLVDQGLAWRTIGVHRSAVSSILEPHKTTPVGQDPLVCRFMKGVFNLRPPKVNVIPTWDVGSVLETVAQWHPPVDIDLPTLTRKVAFLLAICSAKRLSDLMLFSVDVTLCFLGEECVILQTKFGSKTDRPSHRALPLKLKKCADERLCPVLYVKTYVERTSAIRAEADQLFISPYHPHRPIKLATLRRWILAVLRAANAVGSAGSTRATATSCAILHDVPLQRIMACADWSPQSTPIRHYLRVLPEETLRSIQEKQAVQDAVLPH